VLLVAACNSGQATPAPPAAQPPVSAPRDAGVDADVSRLSGKPLYLALCAQCHGADGRGYVADHAPSLVSPTFLDTATDDYLRGSIIAGRPGTSMAAYSNRFGGPLDAAGVTSLVKYLRAQGGPAKPLTPVATGDAAVGAAVYAKRCVTCHGDTKTRGEAVSLANPRLLAAASDPFLRYAVVHGRPGTKMEPFAGVLSDAELDGVVAYVRGFASDAPPEVALLPPPLGSEPVVINPSGKTPKFTVRADPCPPASAAAASGPGAPATPPCRPDPRFVSVAQVAAAVAAKQRLVIIDARPSSEWRRVHLPGAVSIPYHDLKRLDDVPKDGTWIIAYCACPHHLSGIVVDELRKRGYAHAVVLDEGINDWHRRGFPVVAAEGVTKPLGEAPAR
jgi:mono/diheme cytochrome c family protein/rhodanese-related sulfurtransferase